MQLCKRVEQPLLANLREEIMPPRTLVLLATLLAAASAQVSQPSIKTVSGSIELAVPLDGSVRPAPAASCRVFTRSGKETLRE